VQYTAVSALTHEGMVREHNEDSLVVGPWTTCAAVTQTPQTLVFPATDPVVVAVADGLGGHAAGEVASTAVVQALARAGPALGDEEAVRAALEDANREVYDAAEREPAWRGMGTTVAGVVVTERSVVVFNVGDSRVYVLDEDGLQQLSVDDNPPLAPGETHTSVLTQTMGGQPRDRAIDSHVTTRDRRDHDTFLVCTDGLSDVVDADTITAILQSNNGQRAVYELWRAAVEAGGPDNITVATVDFGDSEDAEGG
jgi:PPM family protein phosphatase